MIKTFCDQCGTEIKEPNIAIIKFQEQKSVLQAGQTQQVIEQKEILLCHTCKKALEEYIVREQNKNKK